MLKFTRQSAPLRVLRARNLTSSLRYFSSSSIVNDAVVVSGTKLAKSIRQKIGERVVQYNAKIFPEDAASNKLRFRPSLTIIQVGHRPDSSAYVRSKLKAASSANIDSNLIHLEADISEDALLDVIDGLNKDPNVNGLLIQLPLPKHLNETLITNSVATEKDCRRREVIPSLNHALQVV